MDKVTCLAFLLYQSSNSPDIKLKAIQLLNGDVSIRDLRKLTPIKTNLAMAESLLKKNYLYKDQVQKFAEKYLLIEV